MKLTGGCLCKKVRYSVQTDVSKPASNYCHCRMCQLATGSPVAVFFSVPEVTIHDIVHDRMDCAVSRSGPQPSV